MVPIERGMNVLQVIVLVEDLEEELPVAGDLELPPARRDFKSAKPPRGMQRPRNRRASASMSGARPSEIDEEEAGALGQGGSRRRPLSSSAKPWVRSIAGALSRRPSSP